MLQKKLLIIVVLSIAFSTKSFGQFYYTGDDPASTKWRQLKSTNYTIIYPEEIDSLARRYATLLEFHREEVMKPLNITPKRLPIILHPYTVVSNGVVTWAPKRMELFTSPSAHSSYSENWETQLSIHESRHVGQITHYTEGIFKSLSYILGEQLTGVALGLCTAGWSLEGDAVLAETELSNTGRGRSAEFLQYYRTAYLENNERTFGQWKLGSYYNFTPDHYAFGYYLYSANRYYNQNNKHPEEFFSTYRKNWKSLKRAIAPELQIYNNFDKYQELRNSIWKEELARKGATTPYDTLRSKQKKYYTENTSPISTTSGTYFIKNGMYRTPSLYFMDKDGKEQYIKPLSYSINKLVPSPNRYYWAETVSDPRWGLQSYSNIYYFDLATQAIYKLTSKTKFFNPSVSKGGDSIAVAEYPTKGSSFLAILNKEGKVQKRIEAPYKGQIRETAFIEDDIYCTIITDRGMGIYRYSDNNWEQVVNDQHKSIERLRSTDNSLYFCSDLDGVLNIYSYEPKNQALWQLTNSKYGADYPYFNEKADTLYYSEYSLKGYEIAKTSTDSLYWQLASFKRPYKDRLADLITAQSLGKGCTTDTIDYSDSECYPSKPYNKISKLFRIHSWAPVYYNVDNIMNRSYDYITDLASLGATIYSQNSLGTATTVLGYSYSRGRNIGHVKFRYSGLYPVFELDYQINRNDRYNFTLVGGGGNNGPVLKKTKYNSPLMETSLNMYIPFEFNSGGWHRGLIPQLTASVTNNTYYSYERKGNVLFNTLSYGARYYQTTGVTTNMIYPKLGFGLSALGGASIATAELFGKVGYVYGYGYLPGFARTHGIKVTATYQKRYNKGKQYNLVGFANLPRGYQDVLPKDQYFKATLDYAMPFYLGDYHLLKFLYLKRLKVMPFIDYASDYENDTTQLYYSYGTSLIFDINIFHFSFPFGVGVQYARTGVQTENSRNNFNFIFDVSF